MGLSRGLRKAPKARPRPGGGHCWLLSASVRRGGPANMPRGALTAAVRRNAADLAGGAGLGRAPRWGGHARLAVGAADLSSWADAARNCAAAAVGLRAANLAAAAAGAGHARADAGRAGQVAGCAVGAGATIEEATAAVGHLRAPGGKGARASGTQGSAGRGGTQAAAKRRRPAPCRRLGRAVGLHWAPACGGPWGTLPLTHLPAHAAPGALGLERARLGDCARLLWGAHGVACAAAAGNQTAAWRGRGAPEGGARVCH
jgi:hypothetical protein